MSLTQRLGKITVFGRALSRSKSVANYNTIILEKDNGIAKLTLNRPEKLNVLNREMYLEIGKAIDELEGEPPMPLLLGQRE
ncbi:MAG: hypothetical protein B1H11_07150 [Desulfobacteraceae bacterium 4484_190.1]|nr:MAG: hypothetical protein B1H11_07150 [Desulfobacteraceae bacterium 4484_190.1]